MIGSKDKDMKHNPMVVHIKANTSKEKNKGREN